MPKISNLPDLTSPADDDEIVINDESASTTKKASLTTFITWVQAKLQAVTAWITADNIDFGGSGSGIWWEEIGRTTLGSAGTTITVNNLPTKKYLKIIISAQASGGLINTQFTFNNDSSNLYRQSYISQNSGTNTDTGAITQVAGEIGQVTDARGIFLSTEFYNPSNNTKYGVLTGSNEQHGSGVPAWIYSGWRYVTNTQVTRIDFVTTSNNFAAGSEVIVLGHN